MDSLMKNLKPILKFGLVVIFALLFTSCGLAFKTLMGLKNPKVETSASINEEIDKLQFKCDPGTDVWYKPQSDSLGNYKILLSSMNSDLYFFNSEGKRLCFSSSESCVAEQFEMVETKFEDYIGPCSNDYEFEFVYEDIDEFLSNVQEVSGSDLSINNLPKVDYYFIYHWSKFAGGKKNKKEDYLWTMSSLDELGISYHVIRVNTDLREDAGFRKNKKVRLKLKMQKEEEGRTAELFLSKLPYEKED